MGRRATFSSNVVKVVIKFLKENIFTRFGMPRAIIIEEGSHFVINLLNLFLQNMG